MGYRDIVMDRKKLSAPCREVTHINQVQNVIQNLRDTAKAHKDTCAGLAANQIGYDVRVFVVRIRGKYIHFINPSFKPIGSDMITFEEGCLSFPGKVTKTKRHVLIEVYGNKKARKLILSGIEAIAFQHEIDHLNGICI